MFGNSGKSSNRHDSLQNIFNDGAWIGQVEPFERLAFLAEDVTAFKIDLRLFSKPLFAFEMIPFPSGKINPLEIGSLKWCHG